jgi:hypothetical protein
MALNSGNMNRCLSTNPHTANAIANERSGTTIEPAVAYRLGVIFAKNASTTCTSTNSTTCRDRAVAW